jgi:hypothetical protein
MILFIFILSLHNKILTFQDNRKRNEKVKNLANIYALRLFTVYFFRKL